SARHRGAHDLFISEVWPRGRRLWPGISADFRSRNPADKVRLPGDWPFFRSILRPMHFEELARCRRRMGTGNIDELDATGKRLAFFDSHFGPAHRDLWRIACPSC